MLNPQAYSSPKEDPELSTGEKELIMGGNISKEPVTVIPWKLILSKPPVWALIICHFCHNWGTFILLTWMPTYYNQVRNWFLQKWATCPQHNTPLHISVQSLDSETSSTVSHEILLFLLSLCNSTILTRRRLIFNLAYSGFEVQPHWIGTLLCLAMVDHGCFCKYRRLDCRYTCQQRSFCDNSSQGKDYYCLKHWMWFRCRLASFTFSNDFLQICLLLQIMQSIGFLGPAFFLSQLSRVKTPAMAVLCMACSQVKTTCYYFDWAWIYFQCF